MRLNCKKCGWMKHECVRYRSDFGRTTGSGEWLNLESGVAVYKRTWMCVKCHDDKITYEVDESVLNRLVAIEQYTGKAARSAARLSKRLAVLSKR